MMGRRRSEDEDKEEEGKQEDECSAPLSESSTDEKDGNNQFFQLFRFLIDAANGKLCKKTFFQFSNSLTPNCLQHRRGFGARGLDKF